MKVTCLGTGSSGNCFHVEFDNGENVILDAGIKPSVLIDHGIGIVDSLILVTHEHGDHIKFADEMVERFSARVVVSERTDKFIKRPYMVLEADKRVQIDGLQIVPFKVIHNAENPVGYYVSDGFESLVYITDAGVLPQLRFGNVDVLMIEANYTEQALEENVNSFVFGRVSSGFGHLSVEQAFQFAEPYLDKLDLLLLTHVSKHSFCQIEYHGNGKISKAFKKKAIIAESGKEYLSLPF